MNAILAACCWMSILPSDPAGPGKFPDDLAEWIETDPPELYSERWWSANNDTRHEWLVSLRDGRPHAGLLDPGAARNADLPFRIEPGEAREGLAGRTLAIRVDDGWLVAFNAGEFGAGLWWFSPDGSERYKIAEAWINQFLPTRTGLLALEGLAHGAGPFRGRILRLTRPPDVRWRAGNFVMTEGVPDVAAEAADGSWIVATTDRLYRLDPARGATEALIGGAFWESLYPTSMVVAPSGEVYIGMRHGVARASAKDGVWTTRWLLPNEDFDRMKPEFPAR